MTLSIDSWRKDRSNSSERGYGLQWQRVRHRFLLDNPLCVMCAANDHTTPADVVDHIKPHRGDRALF